MYESFYGLRERPFQTNPNPALYFASRQHKRAMSFLEYGLHRNEGFIVITGEIGAGKTTVLRSLISKLDPGKFIIANLVSTQLDAENALRMVAAALGLKTAAQTKSELLIAIQDHLLHIYRSGRRCLLIVDEVQNLSLQAVEELRMLSNFQQDTHTLVQTFLVGQPEFRHTLQSPSLTQLRQRVTASCHIGPLDADDTKTYIQHRLTLCGWNQSPNLDDAYQAIYDCTEGIPRRINAVCDRLLLSGFLSNSKVFTQADVTEVYRELDSETFGIQPAKVDASGPAGKSPSSGKPVEAVGQPGNPVTTPAQLDSISLELQRLSIEDWQQRFVQLEQKVVHIDNTLSALLANNTKALTLMKVLIETMQQQSQTKQRSAKPIFRLRAKS